MEKLKNSWPLMGNENIMNYLTKSILKGKVACFYIFAGSSGLGKTTAAFHFAKTLLCQNRDKGGINPCEKCHSCQKLDVIKFNKGIEVEDLNIPHGDFHLIRRFKDKKNISIEQVRDFINKLSLSSFLGRYKIGIIRNADRLSAEAANALLKTLEEPKDKVVIIMTVENCDNLPKTILSRSQVLKFNPVKKDIIYDHLLEKYKLARSQARNISRLSLGKPALSKKFMEDKEYYNEYLEKADVFIDILRNNNINQRFDIVNARIGKNLSGQENSAEIIYLIAIWQSLIRDLLLLNLNLPDLMQHIVLEEKLAVVGKNYNNDFLIKIYNILQRGKQYLNSNVNPKLVLEGLMINI